MPTSTKPKPKKTALVHEGRAMKRLMQLLSINGVSCEEREVAQYIIEQLRSAGIPKSWIHVDDVHQRSPRGGNVGNVICKFPGTTKGARRLFCAHMDTVPICRDAWPLRQGDFIVSGNPAAGVGADNRSSVAVVLNTAMEILRRKLPHPPLTFLFFVQEEVGLLGAKYLDTKLLGGPKLCFNYDSGNPARVQIGATGAIGVSITVDGLASHAGSRPEKGISAIAIASIAMADLYTNGWHGQVKQGKNKGTSNFGIITGGQATNVVPDKLTLKAGARSHNAAFRKRIVEEYRKAFERAVKKVRNVDGQRGSVAFKASLSYEAFKLSHDDPSTLAACDALREMNIEPETFVSNGGVDATWLTAHGLATVTLGSGQSNAHTLESKVTISHYLQGCELAIRLALID